MELIPILITVILLAAIIWFVAKKNRENAAEAEAEDARLAAEIEAEEAELAELEKTAPPVKGTDHLAPKTYAKQDALDDNAWRRSHGYAENDTPTQDELDRRDASNAPKIPKPPVNNTYYGQQPRIARQDDSVIRTQNDANTAFLALIAAQQAQEAAELAAKQAHPSNNPAEDPATPEPSTDTPAEVEEAVIHAPEPGGTPIYDKESNSVFFPGDFPGAKDDTPATEEKYVPADPDRNTFDYDSSDNASTYNSTTDNGSDSGSSSGSSYGSSDSSSSSSYDSGSSSSSYDSGSSSSFDSGSSGSFD